MGGMAEMRMDRQKQVRAERVAELTTRGILICMALLGVAIVVLGLGIGEPSWPPFVAQHRAELLGLAALLALLTFCAAPLIIRANSRPRTRGLRRSRWEKA